MKKSNSCSRKSNSRLWDREKHWSELHPFHFSIFVSPCPLGLLQGAVTFELTYNAPDGSVGSWQKEGFEYRALEDDGGGGPYEEDGRGRPRQLGSDSDSMPSSPSKSFKGSRLSISSGHHHQSLKSPTKAWVLFSRLVWVRFSVLGLREVTKTAASTLLPADIEAVIILPLLLAPLRGMTDAYSAHL